MPWDARSCRVFLEIPDKSWCCYLAFDSFPCMEAKSSCFLLPATLSGEGLTPRYQYNKAPHCPGPGEPPFRAHNIPSWTQGCCSCWDMEGAMGQELPGSGSGLGSPTPSSTPRLEGGALLPDPAPIMDSSQASFPYLHH